MQSLPSELQDTISAAKNSKDFNPVLDAIPYAKFLGIECEAMGEDLIFKLPVQDDIQGNPIGRAQVNIGDEAYSTDNDGLVYIANQSLRPVANGLICTKEGYYEAIKSVNVSLIVLSGFLTNF